KMFKMQFKPSVWIMVITIPLFIWMYWNFTKRGGVPPAILDTVGTMPTIQMPFISSGSIRFNQRVIPYIPIGQAWFVWYILCSFGFGQIMRKVLGVNPST
ncbi:MAG: EMC3/TMCO1 family protein, partial [Halobacteria archaeon]|nr:EMC3/TMCO1 family protein [Halobacteria archaeon]